ncbi:hypothetical protein FD723_26345 [Nostoc sp. C052]|nr:hypothetical protein FD723_26345 [Nostoc sp. C052]
MMMSCFKPAAKTLFIHFKQFFYKNRVIRSIDFGFWILDFGLTPTTRVRGIIILNLGFWIYSAH